MRSARSSSMVTVVFMRESFRAVGASVLCCLLTGQGVEVGFSLFAHILNGSLVFLGDGDEYFELVVVRNHACSERLHDAREPFHSFVNRHLWAVCTSRTE